MRGRKRGGRRRFASGLRSTGPAGASTARGTGRVIRRMTQASGPGGPAWTGSSSPRGGRHRQRVRGGGAGRDAVLQHLGGPGAGRIALTLLITMAPFAVLAPFIGPMLDRVRDGRRYIMIGTLLARGLLCWGMAGAVQHSDTVTPAGGVRRAGPAEGVRGDPQFGHPPGAPGEDHPGVGQRADLARRADRSTVGVGVAGAISVLAGGGTTGATWVLRIGTLVYLAAIALGIRLPTRVDQQDPQPAAADGAGAGAAGAGADGATIPQAAMPGAGAPQPPRRTLRGPPPAPTPRRPRGGPAGAPPCATWTRSWARPCAVTPRCAPLPAT